MDNTGYIALSRQMALWKQMDVVSNNMANMNTTGYKQDNALFTSYLVETPDATGIGADPLYFTQDYATIQNFSEGALKNTGNTFDVAIKGDAFFAVDTMSGEKYTRKGQFSLDSDGKMITNEGATVLSEENTPFFFAPGEKNITITESGDVITENGMIGKIKLVSFENNQELLKFAGTMFENTDNNQMNIANENIQVAQGTLESSNVNAIDEMTKLIKLQRSYEYVQQMIDNEHDRISNTITTYAQLA